MGLSDFQSVNSRRGKTTFAGSFANLNFHIVFSTKERRPILHADLREVMFPYLSGILTNLKGHLRIGNGVADHVHLLVRLHQETAVAECVRVLKANSSKWLREYDAPDWLGWQDGYGAFSVSRRLRITVVDVAGMHNPEGVPYRSRGRQPNGTYFGTFDGVFSGILPCASMCFVDLGRRGWARRG